LIKYVFPDNARMIAKYLESLIMK